MKLDRPGAPHAEPLAPAEWTIDIASNGRMLVGVIKRGHESMCHVSITAEGILDDEQRTLLAEKARAWIADYLSRPHSGATGFADL